MGSKNSMPTLIACIAVGLASIIAIAVIAVKGLNGPSGDSSSTTGSETLSVGSTPSEDTVTSVESTTSSDSSNDTSSETESSSEVESSNDSSTVSSSTGSNTAQMPDNDGDRVCYLTFDDGPSKTVTAEILEVLKEYDVKATFFVAGTGNMSMLTNIHADGHAIGLHTNTHDYSIYKSVDTYFKDLNAVSDKVYEKTGVRSSILRFPGGSSNTVSKKYCKGIMTTLTKEVQDRGYSYFDWNVDSNDANASKMQTIDGKKRTPKSTIVSSVLNSAKGKDKICVLMHDIAVKTTTADALPEIIEGLKAQGYRFDTLSTSSPIFHMKVNN